MKGAVCKICPMQHFMSVDIVNKLGHLNSHLTTKKGVEAIQSNMGEKTFDGLTLSSPIYLLIFSIFPPSYFPAPSIYL